MNEEHINFLRTEALGQLDPPPKSHKKRTFFIVTLIVLLAIFGVITFTSSHQRRYLSPVDYDPTTLQPKKPTGFFQKLGYFVFGSNVPLQGEKEDRINILLLGMGGVGHDGPFLTDTMMLASIKPSTKQVALISIPRDLAVQIPGYGERKINHANSFGEDKEKDWGGAFATEVVEKTFDIKIPYYIRMDFKAFEEVIDEVGGVTVHVDKTFTDYMYPAANEEYQTVSFKAGSQTMEGSTALIFARSRHGNNGEGSDFARAKRQQKIILALKEKVLSFSTLTNPVRIQRIMDSLEKHMTTNMAFDELITLVKMARDFNHPEIKNLILDTSVGGYLKNVTGVDGALLAPVSGNFDSINNAIQHIFETTTTTEEDSTPAQQAPSFSDANIEIQNGTWRAGLAAQIKQSLIDKKFFVDYVGNAPAEAKPISSSAIYAVSQKNNEYVMQALQTELHIPIKQTVPQGIGPSASSTDILILLGDDFTQQ